jgi:uncharacterized NAD-dependent epimerase/dehydratase family protein
VKNAVVLARGQFRTGHAKTAHGLILHGKKFRIVAVIDETCAGQDAGQAMGFAPMGIPIVADLSCVPGIPPIIPIDDGSRESGAGSRKRETVRRSSSSYPAARPPSPCTLIVGVAPAGGRMPPKWRRDIREAICRRLDIVSGLHDFIGDDTALADIAAKMGVRIWDVRRPPEKLVLFKGLPSPVPVVLTCGTDASSGKRTVTAELHRAARERGIDAAFVATGQTGIMVGADVGTVIDHLPGDFMSGMVEDMVQKMVRKGKELIFVQGQASLTHPAYGPVTLGILFGARPHYVVMVHVAGRDFRPGFPDQPVNPPTEELGLVSRFSDANAVGLAINCQKCADPAAVCREYERSTGLLTVDVLKDGPKRILDSLLLRLRDDRRFHFGPGLKNAINELEGRKERSSGP